MQKEGHKEGYFEGYYDRMTKGFEIKDDKEDGKNNKKETE
jgi:hypothetical protein